MNFILNTSLISKKTFKGYIKRSIMRYYMDKSETRLMKSNLYWFIYRVIERIRIQR